MRRAICVLTALLTAGCGRYEPLSLHGAGSMRVEVEVYKGPLSVPVPGQVGEIVGVLSDSIRAMNDWEMKARRVEARVCGGGGVAEAVATGQVADDQRDLAEAAKTQAKAAAATAAKARSAKAAADQLAQASAAAADVAKAAAAAAPPGAAKVQAETDAAKAELDATATKYAADKAAADLTAADNAATYAAQGQVYEDRLARDAERQARTATAPTSQDWGNCRALRNALSSSHDIITAACYMIRTPTLIKIVGRAVYMPMGTCEARELLNQPSKPIDAETVSDAKRYPTNDVKSVETYKQAYRKQLIDDIDKCIELVAKRTDKSVSEMVAQLKCEGDVIGVALDNLSTVMRTAAFRSVDGNFRQVPTDDEVRGLLVEFGYTASEYGNHLQSRVTVLQKQMNTPVGVIDARNLPVSDYLRDSGRTDFIQLYDWLDGASDSHGVTQAGYATNKRPGDLDLQERIRMAQRLTADAYWQKVNEVYASGQGDVAMAFIKDDLGNWDLKSFSNDPSALLASYRKVTDAALKTTIELTRKAALGPAGETAARITSAQRMAGVANQFATGEAPGQAATVAGANLVTLHDRAAARMAAQRTRFETQERKFTADIATHDAASKKAVSDQAALEQDVVDKTAALAAADEAGKPAAQLALAKAELLRDEKREPNAKAKMEADVALKSAQQRLADLPGEAIEAVRATLDDHLAVVAAMQEGIAAKPPPVAPQQ